MVVRIHFQLIYLHVCLLRFFSLYILFHISFMWCTDEQMFPKFRTTGCVCAFFSLYALNERYFNFFSPKKDINNSHIPNYRTLFIKIWNAFTFGVQQKSFICSIHMNCNFGCCCKKKIYYNCITTIHQNQLYRKRDSIFNLSSLSIACDVCVCVIKANVVNSIKISFAQIIPLFFYFNLLTSAWTIPLVTLI